MSQSKVNYTLFEENEGVPENILVQKGRKVGVLSLLTGKQHPTLQAMAEEHAAYQARVGKQGHQLWAERVKRLMADMQDCNSFRECAAESWPGQNEEESAEDAYKCWRQSPGHWSAINGSCSFWGYAMAYNGRQKIWYSCAVFADLMNRG